VSRPNVDLSRLILGFTVPLVAFVAACGDGQATATEPRGVPVAPSAAIGVAPSQTEAIAELVAVATAAWTAKDATAYASIYAEDADVINPVGGVLSGREAVRQGHVFLFNGPFAGSTQTISVRRVEYLTGTIALVDQDVVLTGYAFLPPNGLRATTPGVVRTHVRWVVMKRSGDWEIVAQQMTPFPPTS
jgi:uncharacterized protein (TIGR02246 family)